MNKYDVLTDGREIKVNRNDKENDVNAVVTQRKHNLPLLELSSTNAFRNSDLTSADEDNIHY